MGPVSRFREDDDDQRLRLLLHGCGVLGGLIANLVLWTACLAPSASAATVPAWGRAQELTFPSNTKGPVAFSVSCAASGDCVAGGYVATSTGDEDAAVSTESDGTWSQAEIIGLPANATTTAGDQRASIRSVSCPEPGDCTAVGSYIDSNNVYQAMTVLETNGSWAQAQELTGLPPGARASNEQNAALNSVSCSSPGNCTAVGGYLDSNRDNQVMAVQEGSGSWQQAEELSSPANAAANPSAGLNAVSCTSQGNCTAVGAYEDSNQQVQPLVVSEIGGSWGQGQELPRPGAASGALVDLFSVSCTELGDCSTVGFFTDSDNDDFGMVSTETGGSWGALQSLSAPANATTTAGAAVEIPESLSCTSPGDCTAVGLYTDSGGGDEGMTANETSGTWSQPDEFTALPSDAASGNPSAALEGVDCLAVGECTAVGGYTDTSGNQQVMASTSSPLSTVAPVSISTKSLPSGALGSRYQAKLTATGGSGTDTWSAKALPAGLHLNASTGAIIGTPTKTGTTHLSVTVTSAGQTATKTLTITIAGLRHLHLTLHGQHLTLGIPAACVATGGKLVLTLTSTKTKHAWSFSHAGVYLASKLTHTIKHLPASLALPLKNRKPGNLPLKLTLRVTHRKQTATRTLKHTVTLCTP